MLGFEEEIREAREREAYISYEFYRLLKNAISRGLLYRDSGCEFKEVVPEFPIGERRADLVVFAVKYGRSAQPFLVIEVKVRAYNRPGPSMAKAVKRALNYASSLGATVTPFSAVYDGWELMIFKNVTPYLIGAYGSLRDEDQAENLLLGLEEFSYKSKRDLLNTLPKHADPDFLLKRIMPSIVKELAKDPSEVKSLMDSWSQLI